MYEHAIRQTIINRINVMQINLQKIFNDKVLLRTTAKFVLFIELNYHISISVFSHFSIIT